jgi:hypothetical protein
MSDVFPPDGEFPLWIRDDLIEELFASAADVSKYFK